MTLLRIEQKAVFFCSNATVRESLPEKLRDDDYRKDRFPPRRKPVPLALRSRAGSDDDAISGDTDDFNSCSVIDVSTVADDIKILVAKHCFARRTQGRSRYTRCADIDRGRVRMSRQQ